MQTFREFLKETRDFPSISPVYSLRDYQADLGDAFIAYVDERLMPAMEKAANPVWWDSGAGEPPKPMPQARLNEN